MPTEIDPLLPQNASAPEISGHGFSPVSKKQHEPQKYDDVKIYSKNRRALDDPELTTSGPSPFRTILGIFAIFVGLSVFAALFVPGGIQRYRKTPFASPDTSARVKKILTENPLIGLSLRLK